MGKLDLSWYVIFFAVVVPVYLYSAGVVLYHLPRMIWEFLRNFMV